MPARRKTRLGFTVTLLLAIVTSIASAQQQPSPTASPPTSAPTTQLHAGITYRRETRDNPINAVYIVTVDLTHPDLTVVTVPAGKDDPDGDGPWQTTLQTVRSAAMRENLDIAINGDFFRCRDTAQALGRTIKYPVGSPAQVSGPAMTDGILWSSHGRAGRAAAAVIVTADRRVLVGEFDRRRFPPDARHVLAGNVQLVRDGKNIAARDDMRHPRTAVGIDRDGTMLMLLVVDGRRPGHAAGMTLHELAEEFVRLKCWSAINLDGGGSSTLVARDPSTGALQVLNRPSDGSDLAIPLSLERPVANVLGIRIAQPATRPSP